MSDVLRGLSPARIFARPTAENLWLGPAQLSVLSQLSGSAPLRLLRGAESSGRSTLLQRFRLDLADTAVVLSLAGHKRNASGVLMSLLQDAGLAAWNPRIVDMRNLLTSLIEQHRGRGSRAIMIIDDAEHHDAPAWEEIDRLATLRFGAAPAFEFVLCLPVEDRGSPLYHCFIHNRGAGEELLLPALDLPAVDSYITWRLDQQGLGRLFTTASLRLIARYTEGRIRAIDTLCQMTLLLLRRDQRNRVDIRLVDAAARALGAIRTDAQPGRNRDSEPASNRTDPVTNPALPAPLRLVT